jgi:hypothetical protein
VRYSPLAIGPRKSGSLDYIKNWRDSMLAENLHEVPIALAQFDINQDIDVTDSFLFISQEPCKAPDNREVVGHFQDSHRGLERTQDSELIWMQ